MSTGRLTPDDVDSIRRLQERYAWVVGSADVDAFEELFTSTAVLEERALGLHYEGHGPDGVRAFLGDWMSRPGTPGRQHWIGQTALRGDAENCTAHSLVIAPHLDQGDVPTVSLMFVGTYEDDFEKISGRWRFKRRVLRRWDDVDLVDQATVVLQPLSEGTGPEPAHSDAPDGTTTPDAAVHFAIEDLYADYAWAQDTADVHGLSALFTEDGELLDGDTTVRGRDQIAAHLTEQLRTDADRAGQQHWRGPALVRWTADHAWTASFILVITCRPNGVVTPRVLGYAEDLLVRQNGGWLFRRRRIAAWSGDVLSRFPSFGCVGDDPPHS